MPWGKIEIELPNYAGTICSTLFDDEESFPQKNTSPNQIYTNDCGAALMP